ncbi:MAG TPA: tetratricopeptide repeat protein, partial [Longimicrobiaceae bacterium]|nr:tetratricopeptide repeat protein [Longimicrobiaceae bacterium]
MANLAKLRVEARRYEDREQWRDAILAYRQIIDNPEGEEVDIALYNRIGDLHLRVNETELAVQAYESAVKAYAEVGLYNNAIALCRKILRLVPGRAVTYRTLGQISAAKGFLPDARHYFLEYAERMRRAGRLDESFEALKEFADLSPGDTEVRRLLADQLLHHGRANEAVEQLRILLAPLVERGDEHAAQQVREQILAIDANASTEPLVREARPVRKADDFTDAFDTGDLYLRGPAAEPAAPAEPPAGLDAGAGVAPSADDFAPADGVERIEGFEPTIDAESPFAARPPEPEPEPPAGELPLLDLEGGEE